MSQPWWCCCGPCYGIWEACPGQDVQFPILWLDAEPICCGAGGPFCDPIGTVRKIEEPLGDRFCYELVEYSSTQQGSQGFFPSPDTFSSCGECIDPSDNCCREELLDRCPPTMTMRIEFDDCCFGCSTVPPSGMFELTLLYNNPEPPFSCSGRSWTLGNFPTPWGPARSGNAACLVCRDNRPVGSLEWSAGFDIPSVNYGNNGRKIGPRCTCPLTGIYSELFYPECRSPGQYPRYGTTVITILP